MKIAILSSLSQPTRLDTRGGTELFCSLLASNLAKKGHEVFLFATQDSYINENLVKIIPVNQYSMINVKKNFYESLKRDMTADEKYKLIASLEARTLILAKQYDDQVDIFHDNTSSPLTGACSPLFKKPFITTMHLPPVGFTGYIQLPPLIVQPTNHYVAISQWEKKLASAPYQIYNGIDINKYKFNDSPKDHLIWIGRISASNPKGLKEALIVTHTIQKKLIYQGIISDKTYYEHEIRPLLAGDVECVETFESQQHKNKFFSEAKAFIFPALWEEPFPFVVLESFSSGTPIIAYAKGSLTETVIDGETGFLVNSSDADIRGNWIAKKTGIEGLREAVEKIYSMPPDQYRQMRLNCRKHVEKKFTVERMVDEYEKVYQKILSA